MSWQLVLTIIAFVFALLIGIPLGTAMSMRSARLLSVLGALVFAALTAVGVLAYGTSINLDPLSYALGAFFAISVGTIIGTLIVNFLFGLRDRRPSGMIEF
ncbi:MAG TPA: hypothetical protein VF818_03200 [Ktedonobacterales bacterium]